MDNLVGNFEHFKISALSKSKEINSFVKCTTIGPNRSIIEEEDDNISNNVEVKIQPPKSQTRSSPHTTSAISKVLAEIESKRQENVKEAVNKHVNNVIEFSQKQSLNTKQHMQKQQQVRIDEIQRQELSILQALEQHDRDTVAEQQQLLRYYQELAEKRKQHKKELEERERRNQRINELINGIKRDQVEFRNVYQEIITTIKSCKFQGQLKDVLGDVPKHLKAIPDSMEEVVCRCKAGKISENESRRTSELVQEIKGLLDVVQMKVATLNAAQQQLNAKNVVKPEPIASVQQPQKPVVTTTTSLSNTITATKTSDLKPAQIDQFISKSSLRIYSELQDFLENYTKAHEELLQNSSYKQFRFDCKKAVNIPVNAISAVSAHHLLDKYSRLTDLLTGKTVEVGNSRVCAARHPQGVAFCTNLLAKKFVLQGDLMISSNPEAAFCYAAVIVAIWHDNIDFGKLLLAHFHKQCPYLVPLYPPRAIGQSDEEFYSSQGYHYTDGVVEKQDKFLKRMTGIMRLFSAIIIAKPKRGQLKNPYGTTEGWRWISTFLNLPPMPDITATMLHVFFEIAGFQMQEAYGKTWQKLMIYICSVYLGMIKKIDSGGPVTRLELLLQEYLKRGRFEPPHGMLPNSFW